MTIIRSLASEFVNSDFAKELNNDGTNVIDHAVVRIFIIQRLETTVTSAGASNN